MQEQQKHRGERLAGLQRTIRSLKDAEKNIKPDVYDALESFYEYKDKLPNRDSPDVMPLKASTMQPVGAMNFVLVKQAIDELVNSMYGIRTVDGIWLGERVLKIRLFPTSVR